MKLLYRLEQFVLNTLEWLLAGLFFLLFALIIVLIGMRFFLNSTIIGGSEATTIMFIYTTAVGAAVAIGRREHIAVTYLVEKTPAAVQRGLFIFNFLLLGLINLVMIKFSLPWIERTGSFIMPSLGIPQFWAQISIPIGCSIAVGICAIKVLLGIFSPGLSGMKIVDHSRRPEEESV